MDSERINDLLSRYWNCETSLEEEQELRAYFKGGEIPESLRDAAPLFQYFDEQKGKSLSDISFDSKVIGTIGAPKKGKSLKLVYNTMRIAAGVAVLIAAIWFIRREVHEQPQEAMVDTYDDPKLAFEETKKALLMISKSFGRAEEETKKINLLNEAQQEVKKKKVDS